MAEIDDLFQAALGLAEPWQVTRTAFDATARRLDLYLDFFQHQAYLHARVPRVTCPTHGTRQVTLAWARPGMRVRDVSADMSPALAKGVRASLPHAYLTWDRYHLASHATKAVDEVRRAEAKQRLIAMGILIAGRLDLSPTHAN